MTNFLQLNYYSIGYISGTIFSAFLLVYLLSLKGKSKQTWLLVGYFFFALLLNVGFVLRTSVFTPDIAKPASFVIALYTCFSNLALLSFIYSFPKNRNKKESYISFFIVAGLGIYGYAYYILQNLNSEVFYNYDTQLFEFQTPQSTAPMGLIHFLTFLWILTIIVRKTIGEERELRRKENNPDKRFFHLLSSNARMLRSFGYAVILHTCFSAVYVLYAANKISFADFQLILTSATSIQLFIYTVIYLNNSPQPSSFMVKIVGVTLVTTLTILSIVSRITFRINETYFDEARNIEIETIIKNIGKLDKTVVPENVLYVSSRPKSDGLFAANFKLEHKKLNAVQSKLLFQSEAAEMGKYINRFQKKVLSSKNEWKDYYGLDENASVSVSNRMYRSLKLANGETILLVRYLFKNGDSIYEVAYPYSSYMEMVGSIVIKMATLIVFTALLILLLFPYLFHGGLIRPLMSLLSGVKEVNEGQYEVSVPVQAEDEIGFLSRSFNHMVESIRSAQEKLKDYAETLEEKVVERTHELQQSLEKVQELKTKQDADYYLTSLLIQPLGQNKSSSENVFVEFLTEQKKKFQFKRWASEIGGDLCVSSKITLKGKSYSVILNGDAMGKSMQGAGGALVLGSVFEAILERSRNSFDVMNLFPERWLKNTFIELHNIFTSFDGTMLVSVFVCLLDEESGLLYYMNAEHPFPAYYRDGVANFLPHRFFYRKLGMPINMETSLHINTFQFQPDDVLLIGSDGRDDILIADESGSNMNENEELFLRCVERGNGNLQEIIREIKRMGEVTDDISLIRVEYKLAGMIEPAESEEVNKTYTKARQEFKQKNYDDTIPLLESILAKDPIYRRSRKILKLLTNAYIQKKQYQKAAEIALHYSNTSPEDSDCLFILSKCYKNSGNIKNATDFGERLRLRNPEHKQNLIHLSEIYQTAGDVSRATMLINEAKYYENNGNHSEQ
ncbi:SpoIIE family protein phosphatase [Leptospira yasudae]|uniref:SpoIIE family protein phosphatase n=1 Tax=Leptospira yasudae TaxID=2202201 RepID=UPI001090B66A|nr:SpoIIE family protein phosphatase [Leptospira yasudae]TGN01324.1 HAMP domain-containing protein [Leptospira yasudae]